MNKYTHTSARRLRRLAAVAPAVLSLLAGFVGCQQAATPAEPAPPAVQVVQPKLLDPKLDQALRNQESLVERAQKLKPDDRLPLPQAHSAGGNAVAALERQEATPPAPTKLDDKRSLAVWFSGNEIAETDPCG